jgi:hypothetical protein
METPDTSGIDGTDTWTESHWGSDSHDDRVSPHGVAVAIRPVGAAVLRTAKENKIKLSSIKSTANRKTNPLPLTLPIAHLPICPI